MNTPLLLFLGDIGGSELMLILVVILIFFGANKIPELARGLGKGIREFKDASREIQSEFENAGQSRPNQPPYNQNQYNSTPGYDAAPVQHVPPAADPVAAAPVTAQETTIAPPMDGGITPPVEAQPHPASRPRV